MIRGLRPVFFIIFLTLFLIGCTARPATNIRTATESAQMSKRRVIKLDTFVIPTANPTPTPGPSITPAPTGACQYHIFANSCGQCCANVCVDARSGAAADYLRNAVPGLVGEYNGEAYWCDAKPVIYLYPQKATLVDVVLTIPGTIPVSDPPYPQQGWQDILALPSGELFYQGKSYPELFYEAAITPTTPPNNGSVVESKDIASELLSIALKLGFTTKEATELVTFWLPRLQELNSPYVHISIFDPETKLAIDKVTITPKPDTFIEHIFYFKALNEKISLPPIPLPATPPERIGFVAAEWGGIIDTQ